MTCGLAWGRDFIAGGAFAIIATAAYAGDGAPMPYPYQPDPYLPPAAVAYQPRPVFPAAPFGDWYLRGDIGIGQNNFSLNYLENPLNSTDFAFEHSAMADTVFFGGGAGLELNNWLRFDVTAEYRSRTEVNAFGQYNYGGGVFGDQYHGFLQSLVVLANAYVDIGTWWNVTPFVGVGFGGAYNKLDDFYDIGIGTSGAGIGRNSGSWNPAWAVYAGLAYNVTRTFKVEATYRYLNYGSVTDTVNCFGGCNPDSFKWGSLTSQDFMLGMRWLLQDDPGIIFVPQPPISTRG